ncbi:MAG: TIGR02281 family clan AA aspartic protease, partial [Pseudomonas stutzeri]|nr:TIGR02281 family clan AA aspartic protease [Stutzerimonas stutzeri]
MRSIPVLFAGLLLLPALTQAASMVQVVGLFPGAAVV